MMLLINHHPKIKWTLQTLTIYWRSSFTWPNFINYQLSSLLLPPPPFNVQSQPLAVSNVKQWRLRNVHWSERADKCVEVAAAQTDSFHCSLTCIRFSTEKPLRKCCSTEMVYLEKYFYYPTGAIWTSESEGVKMDQAEKWRADWWESERIRGGKIRIETAAAAAGEKGKNHEPFLHGWLLMPPPQTPQLRLLKHGENGVANWDMKREGHTHTRWCYIKLACLPACLPFHWTIDVHIFPHDFLHTKEAAAAAAAKLLTITFLLLLL